MIVRLLIAVLCSLLLLAGMTHAEESEFSWKDMRAACKGKHDSVECQELKQRASEFCQAHPDNKRCRKLHAMKECHQNPESEKCQQIKDRIKAHCDKHPESKKCVRARIHKICRDDPESQECLTAKDKVHTHFCEKHPNHDKCT